MMTKQEVQQLIKKVYPKLKDYYGLSKFCGKYPTVKLHHNIYARLTGIDEMTGECSPAAEFERETNTIWIYWLEAVDECWVIGTLLHEYTHYLQDGNEMKKLYNDGYTYDNHPFELEATKEEEKWNLFI